MSAFSALTQNAQEQVVALNNADDYKLIQTIEEKREELVRDHAKRQQEVKDIVKSYSGKIAKVKEAIVKEEARVAKVCEEAKLVEKKQDAVREEIAQHGDQAEKLSRQLQELQQELQLAEKRVAAAKASEELSVPKIKHALSLYANISNIRWDFNTKDRVKGYVSTPGSGTVRPFDLDKRYMKPYEVANHLWSMSSTATLEWDD